MVSTQPENPELSRLYTPLAPSFPATAYILKIKMRENLQKQNHTCTTNKENLFKRNAGENLPFQTKPVQQQTEHF